MSTDVTSNGQQQDQQSSAATSHDNKRIYVGNLPFKATVKELKELFSDYTVTGVNVPKAKITSQKNGKVFFRKKGFAFVELSTPEEAKSAVEKMSDNTTFGDRQLGIKFASAVASDNNSSEKRKKKKKKAADDKENNDSAAASSSSDNKEAPATDKKVDSKKSKQASSANKKPPPANKNKRSVRTKDLPDTTDTIFVTGLPRNTKKPEIEEFFKEINPSSIKIAVSPPKRVRSKDKEIVRIPARTYAFIKVADESVQKKAIETFNDKTFHDDVVISVKVAKEEYTEEEGGTATSEN